MLLYIKESLGLEKKTTVSKALAESSNRTEQKTKQNFRSRPDAPSRLHLSGTYHPLSRTLPHPTPAQKTYHPLSGNLPPPIPAQKTYHPLPNYKCHLN